MMNAELKVGFADSDLGPRPTCGHFEIGTFTSVGLGERGSAMLSCIVDGLPTDKADCHIHKLIVLFTCGMWFVALWACFRLATSKIAALALPLIQCHLASLAYSRLTSQAQVALFPLISPFVLPSQQLLMTRGHFLLLMIILKLHCFRCIHFLVIRLVGIRQLLKSCSCWTLKLRLATWFLAPLAGHCCCVWWLRV